MWSLVKATACQSLECTQMQYDTKLLDTNIRHWLPTDSFYSRCLPLLIDQVPSTNFEFRGLKWFKWHLRHCYLHAFDCKHIASAIVFLTFFLSLIKKQLIWNWISLQRLRNKHSAYYIIMLITLDVCFLETKPIFVPFVCTSWDSSPDLGTRGKRSTNAPLYSKYMSEPISIFISC